MWRFWEGSEDQNGYHEEGTGTIKKASKIERSQHQDHDARPGIQTKQWDPDIVGKTGWEDRWEWEAERKEDEGTDK